MKKMNDKNNLHSTSRRQFLKTTAIASTGFGVMGMKHPFSLIKTENQLRVIAYNVYNATGWPREHSKTAVEKTQMAARIAQELLLYSPDIITFAESPPEDVVQEIANLMNSSYCFLPSGGCCPGAILTSHRILDYRNVPLIEGEREADLFTRHWGKANIQLISGQNIVLHSAHLMPGREPKHGAIRAREITYILKSMKEDLSQGKNMLIMGDLNHTPDMAGYAQWIGAGLVDTFSSTNEAAGYTFSTAEPYQRIDYVLAKGPISNRILESRPLFEGAFRTNTGDSSSFALSDHLPQLAVFGL